MRAAEIEKGGLYLAKVNGRVVRVRVENIYGNGGRKRYGVVSILTGRRLTFNSAGRFRGPAGPQEPS